MQNPSMRNGVNSHAPHDSIATSNTYIYFGDINPTELMIWPGNGNGSSARGSEANHATRRWATEEQ